MELPPVNIDSGFFYFTHPQNRKELEIYSKKLYAYKRALYNTFLNSNDVFVVTNYMAFYHNEPSPRSCELSPLIHQVPTYCAPKFVLKSPMQDGEGMLSQVWRGIMTSEDCPDLPPTPVVIKLYQESLFKYQPCIGDFWGYLEWFPRAQMAANEAWAYDCMRIIQGNISNLGSG